MGAGEFIGNVIAYTIIAVFFLPMIFAVLYYLFIAIAYHIPPLRRKIENRMK